MGKAGSLGRAGCPSRPSAEEGRPSRPNEMRLMAQGTLRKLGALVVLASVFAAGCSKSAADYVKSGDAFATDGKPREALIEYRNAVQKEATNGEARLKLAETHEKLGEIPQAFREYVRAADLLQKDVAVQVKAGTFLLLAGRSEDAKVRAELSLIHI